MKTEQLSTEWPLGKGKEKLKTSKSSMKMNAKYARFMRHNESSAKRNVIVLSDFL